jgi:hypothetical protein
MYIDKTEDCVIVEVGTGCRLYVGGAVSDTKRIGYSHTVHRT